MRYGLLGETLGHSFSKELHERLGRYPYELIEVPPEMLDAFLRGRDFDGLNVTIPYKQAVLPYLDSVSDRARAIGAVNVIVNWDGRLHGDNTDFGGMKALLSHMDLNLRGKKVLIAGSGGTGRTAQAAAEALGAAEVYRLSRSGRDGALTYESAYRDHADAAVLINTTPAGMYPDTDSVPADLDRLPGLEAVADAVYNPLNTKLVLQARARGIRAENGLYMLVCQAVLSAELFTGEAFPPETSAGLYRTLLREKQNLVLIGMPGCGKTTLGKLLAERLGREYVSCDGEAVRRAGRPIAELFRTRGEAYFRDLESRILSELSRTGGRVIATGGGAVLRRENVDTLRSNGLLIFLDRDVNTIQPSADRPLSDDRDKLEKLFAERYPIYLAAADRHVSVSGTPEDTLKKIMRIL